MDSLASRLPGCQAGRIFRLAVAPILAVLCLPQATGIHTDDEDNAALHASPYLKRVRGFGV